MTEHPNLAAALVAALADLSVVEKGRTAKIPTKDGKSYSYDYAAIEDVIRLTRPILASHGIVALTPVHAHGNELACTVTLLHTSGDRLDLGPFPFPHGKDAQATGSMVTYHRRYALVAALGMAAGDDDDGATAAPRSAAPSFPCKWCSFSTTERDAMREHLVSRHDFIRNDDGTVTAPKPVPEQEADDAPFDLGQTRPLTDAEAMAERARAAGEKVAAGAPRDVKVAAAGGAE